MTELMRPKNYARIPVGLKLPHLIEVQLKSFEQLKTEGLANLFDSYSPIDSHNGDLRLHLPSSENDLKFWFKEPKNTIEECLERDLTYARPLYIEVMVEYDPNKPPEEKRHPVSRQELFLGDFPEITQKGTFIINGTERVVVSQLIRSPGVYFDATQERSTGRMMSTSLLIPDRGPRLEFETRKNDNIMLKFNKVNVSVTMFLRSLAAINKNSIIGTGSDDDILELFAEADDDPDHPYIENSFAQEPEYDLSNKTIAEAALLELYRRLRPGEPLIIENAKNYLSSQIFEVRQFDLEMVGRYKLNQKLGLDGIIAKDQRTITEMDIVYIIRHMIRINNGRTPKDDIDHLGNRRVKTVGELIQNQLRIGMRRMERTIKERMSLRDTDAMVSATAIVNIRPLVASLREFFGSSQLSQFMEETNPLSELRHKRTVSALGKGGLKRERAGFEVRDVHYSHYGRICPIETPEGPNIGLISRLAAYAQVNEFGFIETPYRKVYREMKGDDPALVNHLLRQNIVDPNTGEIIYEADKRIDEAMAKKINELGYEKVDVRPYVSDDYEYLSADAEDKYVIAQANAPLNEYGEFLHRNSCRYANKFGIYNYEEIDYIDVAPNQVVGISAALIPFLEHDDANRALMGANMQTQAVPLLRPQVPIVSTGMEGVAVADSGQITIAEADGEVISVTGDKIVIKQDDGQLRTYNLRKYHRSNQSTCIDQRPSVTQGDFIKAGDVIIDSSSTQDGKLALGQNAVIAFLPWEGFNFEDAILISEKLVEDDRYTSIHIEKYEVEARDTKLGPEEITREIPNVGDETIRDLDEAGIIRIGAEVGPGDILVGKITPKGEKELTPEERLLRAIFGEKSRDVKDTSLRMPHGERGTVVDVKVFTREENDDLNAGVDKMVRVSVAQRRKITAGDKMAGRHGNKGCISMVLPAEDMPFLEDGTPVDIILNPLGIPGRMNIGQVLESELGWAVSRLGFRAITPVFDGAKESEIAAELARAWMIDEAWRVIGERGWAWLENFDYDPEMILDDEQVRLLYLETLLANKNYDLYAIKENRTLARRATLDEWLISEGYNPREITAFPEEEVPVHKRDARDDNAFRACLQLWAKKYGKTLENELTNAEMKKKANEIMDEIGQPVPIHGKQLLRDGRTGELYDRPVMIGVMSMLKLHHLVEDKVHARSTGPYSLVTQQPLGGKAQFGGQRFGEMEVWALEAYGAAYTLQEMLTIKSDDVAGRTAAYEAIVKGNPIEAPGIPAAFRVLVKELQSLSLAVEAIMDDKENSVVSFGKDDERNQPRNVETGLISIGKGYDYRKRKA